MIAPRTRSAVLLAALFLSSAAALISEVSWGRMLGLALGGTVVSYTVVLMAWMAGLALGSIVWGRIADRVHNASRLFAYCQLCALAGMSLVMYFFTYDDPSQPLALRYGIFAFALLLQTFNVGGAYPVIARALAAGDAGIGRAIGAVAAVDALGGAAGGLACGFLLLGALGQNATLLLAAGLTLLAAVMAWTLPAAPVPAPAGEKTAQRQFKQDKFSPVFITVAAAVTGLSGMALQVAWTRTLQVFLPNTSYSFSLVAGVLILGLAAGSGLYRLAADRIHRPLVWLAGVQAAAGVAVAAPSLVLTKLPALVLFPLADALAAAWPRILLPPVSLALVLTFVPALCSGFTFPLLCAMQARGAAKLGAGIGLVRLANAAGGAAGPALAAFLLVPGIGVGKTLQAAGLLALGLALWAAWSAPAPGKARGALAALACAGAAMLLAAPRPMVLPPSFLQRGARDAGVLYYRETIEGTVTVSEDSRTGIRACFVNNSAVVGTTYDAIKVVKLLGHLPFLLSDGAGSGQAIHEVLVVGFGTGVTAATVASHPGVRRIDCVEIAPGVRDAAQYFVEFNRGVAVSPRVSFIAGDGRAYLRRGGRSYDMISADPTHPTLGCAALYTEEYFRLCRARLRPGGYLCQYLPLHGLTPDAFRSIIGTFRRVFPHATVWLGLSHCVLLASPAPLAEDFAAFAAGVRALDDPLFYKDPYSVAGCLMLDEAGAAAVAGDAAACCDDRNFLEFFDPRAKDPDNWERNAALLAAARCDPAAVFAGCDRAVMARYLAGQALFIEGQRLQNRGRWREAIGCFQAAVAGNPADQEYRFLLEQELRKSGPPR